MQRRVSIATSCSSSLALAKVCHPTAAVQTIRVHQLNVARPITYKSAFSTTMNRQNRPRNRQPRNANDQRPARPAGNVPHAGQVVRGAAVSIVLKDDQPTGNETRGVVQNVLTKGNHPRGIKVRLQDGQVGRVQRMLETDAYNTPTPSAATNAPSTTTTTRFSNRYTDVRNEEELEGPPPRSLADFFPAELDTRESLDTEAGAGDAQADVKVTARCPICDAFEGDEVAVSHHVERECLKE